ncbi:splicing factor 3A subunit 1 [Sergentomyia squamirostris]
MPVTEVENVSAGPEFAEEQQKEENRTLSGPIIGIIYPPPEVRNIVDKTASFVARNGPEFEARIRQNEIGNPKFNFLNAGDPYHAYYQHKVVEFRDGKTTDAAAHLPAGIQKLSVSFTAQQKQQELLKQVAEQQFVPKDPPSEFEFIADPPSISALDLDIVKLTAQFVARNGRQFLTNLMNREQRNYQFDFLRPQHSLFQYFTKLLEQYTKILIPPKDLMNKLKSETSSEKASFKLVLEDAKYRANWFKYQEAQKRREEEKVERERVAYAQIDWHDFVVVEIVDYQPYETGNFPPPTTPDEVGARVLMEDRGHDDDDIEMQIESDDEGGRPNSDIKLSTMEDRQSFKYINMKDNNQVQDMDEASSDEDDGVGVKGPSAMAPPLPPTHDKVIVKKYDPKQQVPIVPKAAPVTDDFLISPITGEKIPASKVAEHMRIGLLDPRWVEQRDKHTVEKLNQDNVYAVGTAIEASLKQLAERRTDIFGIGDEETMIGRKLGEEESKKDERVTWDGHTSSVEAATRAARAHITLEDQIHQIHKVKGLLPDEEKEKIGPKPVTSHPNIISKPQLQMSQQIPVSQSAMDVGQKPTVVMTHQAPSMGHPHPHPNPVPVMLMPMRPPSMMPSPFQVGFLPQMGPPQGAPMPGPPLMEPPQQPPSMQSAMDDEPASKKSRTEDHLVPETQFLARHNGPITIQVQVPNMSEKPEWQLNGQTVSITLSLVDTIANLKSKLHDEIGMPPAKQKLSGEGMFFKDSNSLAYYNLLSGATVHLALKERGGRKK